LSLDQPHQRPRLEIVGQVANRVASRPANDEVEFDVIVPMIDVETRARDRAANLTDETVRDRAANVANGAASLLWPIAFSATGSCIGLSITPTETRLAPLSVGPNDLLRIYGHSAK